MKYFNRHVYVQARKSEPVMVSIVEVRVGELIGKGLTDEQIKAHLPSLSLGTIRHYRRELAAAKGLGRAKA